MNKFQNIFGILAVLAVGMLGTGCTNSDIAEDAPSNKGVIFLQMSSEPIFVETSTRASQTLSDLSSYKFTLTNETESNVVNFVDGKLIIEAGTYTLSATNTDAVEGGYSAPLYSGSINFELNAGESKGIALNLGTPKNAMVTLSLSQEFSAKYDLYSMTLTDGTKSSTLTTSNTTAYFPATATTLSYTLVANAKAGSHVQDITSATGTITIAAGTHTPVTLNLNPIDPNLIVIETGTTHSGEFE